jgi:predicted nuclease of predicted toxin-antitoxin system
MSSLRLLADVHIAPLTVVVLRSQGYDIVHTTDLLAATAADAEILEFARVEGKVVLTQDLDFSMLVALSNYGLPSLITLRLSSAKPDVVVQRLLDVLPTVETELTEGAAITISDDSVRVRKLPIRRSDVQHCVGADGTEVIAGCPRLPTAAQLHRRQIVGKLTLH